MKVVVYRDKAGLFRWRIVARNGRIVADSGEGYRRRSACAAMALRIAAPMDVEVRD